MDNTTMSFNATLEQDNCVYDSFLEQSLNEYKLILVVNETE